MMKNGFDIVYLNESSGANGNKYNVREDENLPYHYLINDGKTHTGGGRLLKKYCVRVDKKIKKYYSVRVVEAITQDEAVEMIVGENFIEDDKLSDVILTLEELKSKIL